MQLPIYLYLSKSDNIKSEVVGFYLQKILTGVPKLDSKKDIILTNDYISKNVKYSEKLLEVGNAIINYEKFQFVDTFPYFSTFIYILQSARNCVRHIRK